LKYTLRRCDFVSRAQQTMAEHVRAFGYDGEDCDLQMGGRPCPVRRSARNETNEFRILSIRPCDPNLQPDCSRRSFQERYPAIGNSYLYLLDFGSEVRQMHDKVCEGIRARRRISGCPDSNTRKCLKRYSSGDVAISLSPSDSAGRERAESMACETPVIATDNPPMREWIMMGRQVT